MGGGGIQQKRNTTALGQKEENLTVYLYMIRYHNSSVACAELLMTAHGDQSAEPGQGKPDRT